MEHYTYLLINVLTIFFPLALSFDRRVHFVAKWKFLIPAISISGIVFLIWDYIFTITGVWSFNADYIIGYHILKLPLEEILFFITVPFACVFIYECLNCYVREDYLKPYVYGINMVILFTCILLIVLYPGRIYTLVSMAFLGVVIFYFQVIKKAQWLSRYFLSYLVSLLPFYIVNGLLTSVPIVIYNDQQNMGARVFTIPIEDHFYLMAMLLLTTGIYEHFKNKSLQPT